MNDINSVKPTSIRHIVGQRQVVEQVKVAIDAAQQDSKKCDHALMVGPPGCGKTAVAQVVAAEMATDFLDVLGQSIASVADLNALLLQTTDRAVVFIDEAHELPKTIQTSLYLALDQRRILLPRGNSGSPAAIPIADFTLLLATTDEFELLQPLRDRMRLLLRFQFYSAPELEFICDSRAKALGWDVESSVFAQIGQRSRGTPRIALRILQAAHRVARSQGEQIVTEQHLERALELDEINRFGMGVSEQQYMQILGEGPTRLNVISSRLGFPTRTVQGVIEPFLLRSGFITKDEQGRRCLTAEGLRYVRETQD
jgi:Holliday junction DNA helicase RuvB